MPGFSTPLVTEFTVYCGLVHRSELNSQCFPTENRIHGVSDQNTVNSVMSGVRAKLTSCDNIELGYSQSHVFIYKFL